MSGGGGGGQDVRVVVDRVCEWCWAGCESGDWSVCESGQGV